MNDLASTHEFLRNYTRGHMRNSQVGGGHAGMQVHTIAQHSHTCKYALLACTVHVAGGVEN